MKTILVALDLTESDQAVLAQTGKLAKALDATLHLVHVFPPEMTAMDYLAYVPVDPNERKAAMAVAKEGLEALAEKFEGEGLRAVSELRVGQSAHEILDHAKEIEAELTILGSHSGNRIERALLGSTADKVVRCSVNPVLVVPVENG